MTGGDSAARFRLSLLIAGAATGLLVAASGMMESRLDGTSGLPAGNIARIGDTLISDSRYAAVLEDLRADKRNPLTDEDRRFALDRLIDEELLIQRGIELGFEENSPAVRKAIASELISHIVTDARATRPDDATLRKFHETVSAYFFSPGRLHLRWWRLISQDTADRLQTALEIEGQLVQGGDPAGLFKRYGFEMVTDLPDTLLPRSKLLDYIGPALLKQVSTLQPGQFSSPIDADQALHFFYLIERVQGSSAPFESVREAVEQEYMYRAGDEALREYLAWLRERTPVTVGDSAP